MSSPAGRHEDDHVEIDESTSDALIDGCLSPTDTPAGYEEVAQLIGVIQRGLESEESCGEPPTVAAVVQQIDTRPSIVSLPTRARRRGKKRSVVAAAVVGVLVSAGTAAAATGALPGAIQEAVHDVAADIGISIPGPGASANTQLAGPAQTCRPATQTSNAVSQTGMVSILGPCGSPTGLPLGQGRASSMSFGLPDGTWPTFDLRQAAAPGRNLASVAPIPFGPTSDFSTYVASVPPAAGALLSGARSGSVANTPGGRGRGSSGSGNSAKASGIAGSGESQPGATPHRGTGSQSPSGRQVRSSGTGHRMTGRRHDAPGPSRPPAPRSNPRPPASTPPARPPKPSSPIPPRPHGHRR
jgi:hypothetical protein